MLQNQPKDVPNDYTSGNSSTNTNITTTSRDNVDNNTHPTMSRHNVDQKPFITSIHDKNLYTGEEYNYNVNMVNTMDDIPINSHNNVYSGIDLINDTLSGNEHIDIYDELLKRKENELFGTNHVKQTSIHSVAKPTRDDPIHNQLELFHKWLDRHRDMCEKLKNDNERLAKLKELWENETHSGDINSGIPSGKLSDTPSDNNIHSDIHPSDIPSGKQSDIPSDNNIHSDIPYVLNTDVSIQIHMDNPKPINEFTYVDSNPNQVDDTYVDSNPDNSSMDTILDDLEKYNEPYYDVQDDIYYDVNDDNDISTVDTNAMDVPSKVQIEMDINTKLVKEKYPIGDVWDI
ncbi:acidic terminal segment protein [Plasmodium falciparum Vietnam Oak-Knoll (FVO)]|uniref:Acidic terminal segment protein n=1 Tax=Plasmodium falciparum Vietnam Oak-Knoll (FVO) TaxID=1036723 RepID=A0A024V4C0_PLAFA|nr:acidic terminal segment protein [Plasmodium falciparum Vietnam Oak-Knoll (FVO)]